MCRYAGMQRKALRLLANTTGGSAWCWAGQPSADVLIFAKQRESV